MILATDSQENQEENLEQQREPATTQAKDIHKPKSQMLWKGISQTMSTITLHHLTAGNWTPASEAQTSIEIRQEAGHRLTRMQETQKGQIQQQLAMTIGTTNAEKALSRKNWPQISDLRQRQAWNITKCQHRPPWQESLVALQLMISMLLRIHPLTRRRGRLRHKTDSPIMQARNGVHQHKGRQAPRIKSLKITQRSRTIYSLIQKVLPTIIKTRLLQEQKRKLGKSHLFSTISLRRKELIHRLNQSISPSTTLNIFNTQT